jgi:hypothetical protein
MDTFVTLKTTGFVGDKATKRSKKEYGPAKDGDVYCRVRLILDEPFCVEYQTSRGLTAVREIYRASLSGYGQTEDEAEAAAGEIAASLDFSAVRCRVKPFLHQDGDQGYSLDVCPPVVVTTTF